jgi:hypothetical protein
MNEQILELIKLLKIEKYRVKNSEIWTICMNPEHDDKNIGSFSINLDTGLFNCFSCGYHGNIIYLLSDKGTKYTKAIRLWKQLRNTHEIYIPSLPIDKYIIKSYKTNGFSQYALDRLGDDENTRKILEEYNVYSDKMGNPIFLTQNIRGQYTSAWVRENNKYFLIEPIQAKFDGALFGIHLKPTDKNILVEGPFDALAVRKYTGYRAICGFGTYLTDNQYNILENVNNLIVMMDGDYAGRAARFRITNRLVDKPDLYVAGGYLADPDEIGKDLPQILDKVRLNLNYQLINLERK